ncbi:hypothetical protein AB0L17_31415, partial [Streptomyces cellulosae]
TTPARTRTSWPKESSPRSPPTPTTTRSGSTCQYRLNPDVTATGEEAKLFTGQIQAHVPFPTGSYTAVFTLHTASMEHWASVYRLMSALLQTVSFTDPLEALPGEPA